MGGKIHDSLTPVPQARPCSFGDLALNAANTRLLNEGTYIAARRLLWGFGTAFSWFCSLTVVFLGLFRDTKDLIQTTSCLPAVTQVYKHKKAYISYINMWLIVLYSACARVDVCRQQGPFRAGLPSLHCSFSRIQLSVFGAVYA